MTVNKPSAEDLSAYVDGELDAGAKAEVASAIARNPFIAKQVACLTKLKATLPEIVPEGPKRLRKEYHMRRQDHLMASAVAALVLLVGLVAGVFIYAQSPAKDWLTVAKSHHESWASNVRFESVPERSIILANASHAFGSRILAPDLTAARLSLAAADIIHFEQKKALHLGYTGTRGCRLSLFILPIVLAGSANNPLAKPREGPYRIATWSHGRQGFILMASGMDPDRFTLLTDTLSNYAGFREPFDEPTRQKLAKSRAKSRPCTA